MDLDRPGHADVDTLTSIFHARADGLGEFRGVTHDETPTPYRQLLSHNYHMTVTVEDFHDSPVDVQVLCTNLVEGKYCRSILLRRQSDQAVVQYGIVRLDMEILEPTVRDQILAARIPLGRVLIQEQVLREVQLHQLYEVRCGPELALRFEVPEGTKTYGRTALIYCEGAPAIQLLEIVAPTTA